MPAIMFNTKYDPAKRFHNAADSLDPHYGTPADIDYFNRYPDVAAVVDESRKSNGSINSGYAHYVAYGKSEGRTYNESMNTPASTSKKKYYIIGGLLLLGIGLWYSRKGKK